MIRISDRDKEVFDRIMGLHAEFRQVIAGFEGEPEAYDTFVRMVSSWLL